MSSYYSSVLVAGLDLWGGIITTGVVCTLYCTLVCKILTRHVSDGCQHPPPRSELPVRWRWSAVLMCSLCAPVLQGGLKAVVWTDVFQVGIEEGFSLIHSNVLKWFDKGVITKQQQDGLVQFGSSGTVKLVPLCPQMGIMLAGYVSVLIMSIIIQGGISTIISDAQQGGRLNFLEWVHFFDEETAVSIFGVSLIHWQHIFFFCIVFFCTRARNGLSPHLFHSFVLHKFKIKINLQL